MDAASSADESGPTLRDRLRSFMARCSPNFVPVSAELGSSTHTQGLLSATCCGASAKFERLGARRAESAQASAKSGRPQSIPGEFAQTCPWAVCEAFVRHAFVHLGSALERLGAAAAIAPLKRRSGVARNTLPRAGPER